MAARRCISIEGMRVTTNALLLTLLVYATVSSLLMQRNDRPSMPQRSARTRMAFNALCVLAVVIVWTTHFVGPGRACYYGIGFLLWFSLLVPRYYYYLPRGEARDADSFYLFWAPSVILYLSVGLWAECLPWRFHNRVPSPVPQRNQAALTCPPDSDSDSVEELVRYPAPRPDYGREISFS